MRPIVFIISTINRCSFTLAVSLLILSSYSQIEAHEYIGSVSNSIITVENKTINFYLSVPPNLLSAMRQLVGKNKNDHYAYIADSIEASVGGSNCRLERIFGPDLQKSGNSVYHAQFECPKDAQAFDAEAFTFTSRLFYDIDERHLQFTRIADAERPAKFIYEALLSANNPVIKVESLKEGGSLFLGRIQRFFLLGVEHLLTGYDHILFLFSVVLVTTTFGSTVKVITSFTVAHSITLALAFIGLISLPSSIVEPLIALSIVYVALENLRGGNFSKRWVVTFFFGLVHGLGFVGALKQITVTESELIASILSFNLGIEGGQALIIALIYPLLYQARKRPWWLTFQRFASIIIGFAGLYWLIGRIF